MNKKFGVSSSLGVVAQHASLASYYGDKYRRQVDSMNSYGSLRAINEDFNDFHIVALGRQLDSFMSYKDSISESFGGSNLSSMGRLPEVAIDVITAAYAGSIIPMLASTQPIEEQIGTVYFREVTATANTGGGFADGDVMSSPLRRDNPGNGTLGAQRKQISIPGANGTETDFTAALGAAVRPYSMEVNITGIGNGRDDGNGKIMGFGFDGKINYNTGALELTTTVAPATGALIQVRIDIDVDRADEIPHIQAGLVSRTINAEIWALAADVGTFANLATQKRFGTTNDELVATDLTNALINSLNARVVKAIIQTSKGDIQFNQTAPTGVSMAEHKLGFVDVIARAESNIHNLSGASAVNRYVAGRSAAAFLRGLPTFVPFPGAANTSIALYGHLDGVPVVRATGVVSDNEIHAIANPADYFNAPVVYAPFIPLFLTDTVADRKNVFNKTRAAGVWAGVTPMNDNLVAKITVNPANLAP